MRSRCMKLRVVSRPPTEDELVERARGGDAAAFGVLVRDHQEIAFRTAYLITRNAADAEDATQIALTNAWRALPRFRRGAPVRPWLLAIVANEARNRRRAEGRREGLTLRAAHELPSGGAAPSPEGRVVAAEARAELLEGLERLREDDRLVLACRYLLELGEEETAQVLSVRRGTVKSRTSRALDRLRIVMEEGS
jgi:RNA polymerase sigma factor (sigma-70 family)